MKIVQTLKRIPAAIMIVPMLCGALINTFAPWSIKIGGFTEALGSAGFATICAAYMFCVGTKLDFKAAPSLLKRGFGLLFIKVGVATILAMMVAKVFNGDLIGLSTLAIMAAMNDTNGGMFLALASGLGDENDVGAYVPQSIETGPFLTMLILSGAGLANIPYMAMVSVIIPVIAGFALGNADPELKKFVSKHSEMFVPFLGFALGNNINLAAVFNAGPSGIILGLATVAITGGVCIFFDRLLGGTGIAGAASSSTAGNAVATPKAVAMADPTFAAVAPMATLQVAASVIVTAVLTPVLTTFIYNRNKKKKEAELAGSSPVIE
jgi:2-keto-3-deoxygluconate permease